MRSTRESAAHAQQETCKRYHDDYPAVIILLVSDTGVVGSLLSWTTGTVKGFSFWAVEKTDIHYNRDFLVASLSSRFS